MAAVCTLYPESIGPSIRSDPKLTAEVKFYDALRAQMPSGWLVFYDIAWLGRTRPSSGPRDGQIDFIVAHPEHGILLIEVKGGRIRYDGPSRQWISRDRHGTDHDIDPFRQAVEGKYALLNKLLEIPSLKNLWIELAHAVAFTDTARPDFAVAPDAPPEIVIGCQNLTHLHQRVLEILAYSRQSGRGEFHKGSLIVCELTRLVARSVELPNPLGVDIQEEYREILSLTEAQIRTLSLLQRVRRAALGGSAGCGKTFLALAKAKGLANQGFRTLLTCYTRPLSSFLRSVTAGTAHGTKVVVGPPEPPRRPGAGDCGGGEARSCAGRASVLSRPPTPHPLQGTVHHFRSMSHLCSPSRGRPPSRARARDLEEI